MVKNYSAFTQVGATANVVLNHSFKNEKKSYMITYYFYIVHQSLKPTISNVIFRLK